MLPWHECCPINRTIPLFKKIRPIQLFADGMEFKSPEKVARGLAKSAFVTEPSRLKKVYHIFSIK
jgi:hypothetical protein